MITHESSAIHHLSVLPGTLLYLEKIVPRGTLKILLKRSDKFIMNGRAFLLILMVLVLMGCRKPVEHPEALDPVYGDIQKERASTLRAYQDKQKDIVKAKKTFEDAPIRTGQRQDAQDEYFGLVNQGEKLDQKYRYLAIKSELRKKYDLKAYQTAFDNNTPWPDQDAFAEYETDKRLKSAPREWNPENRIKSRAPAAAKPAATEEGHE